MEGDDGSSNGGSLSNKSFASFDRSLSSVIRALKFSGGDVGERRDEGGGEADLGGREGTTSGEPDAEDVWDLDFGLSDIYR